DLRGDTERFPERSGHVPGAAPPLRLGPAACTRVSAGVTGVAMTIGHRGRSWMNRRDPQLPRAGVGAVPDAATETLHRKTSHVRVPTGTHSREPAAAPPIAP